MIALAVCTIDWTMQAVKSSSLRMIDVLGKILIVFAEIRKVICCVTQANREPKSTTSQESTLSQPRV